MRSWLKDSSVREMAPTEAAWLAGFLDGEGSLTHYRSGRNGKYRSWILSITNTHKGSLDYCQLVTGVGVVKLKRRNNIPAHWKVSYQWQITAQREIVDILKQLQPFLVIKREKAEDFLSTWQDINSS
jgi:hypothetical protein